MSKKILFDKKKQEDLKKELEDLKVFLNYRNSNFCKKKLDNIIGKYFGEN